MATGMWAGKNILITGINGFIGGNLAKRFLSLGANVVGIVRNDNFTSLLHYEKLHQRVKIIHGSITDFALMKRVVAEEEIHYCFHLAAQVEVGVARAYPYLTWETNIRGTYSLLEAFRECRASIEAIVIASSDKAYGTYPVEKMPYKEEYPLIPEFPYDVSKACADMIGRTYASSLYELPVVITRFCNIYGPGQLNFSALIPDASRSALGYTHFVPRGDGTQVRDYMFVDDVVELYRVLAEGLTANPTLRGEVFNAGSNCPKTVREIIKKVFAITNSLDAYAAIEAQFSEKQMCGEINCQFMDHEKVSRLFDWVPKYSFDQGLALTVTWYENYLRDLYGNGKHVGDNRRHTVL